MNAAEKQKYDAVWRMPPYRRKCHSMDLWIERRELFPKQFITALDIGCGLGRLFEHWNSIGIDAWAVDITDVCLGSENYKHKFIQAPIWDMDFGRVFDVGACIDVMEHIPSEMVPQTLERIGASCEIVVFKIAEFSSYYLGHKLHMTIKSRAWWQDAVLSVGGEITHVETTTPQRPNHILVWHP